MCWLIKLLYKMHDAFDNVINDIQRQVVAFLQTKEFRNAAK